MQIPSIKSVLVLSLIGGVLAGCAKKEERLEGTRLELRADAENTDTDAQASTPKSSPSVVKLPKMRTNANWTHRNGTVTHAIDHPQLSIAPQLIWSRDMGTGNTARLRLSADPVVADGRVFVMDANAQISAYSPRGALLWMIDGSGLADAKDEISGGGLAYGDGTLVVTTGYGEVIAIDPAQGQIRWRHDMEAAGSNAPLISKGIVIVIAANTSAVALNVNNGRIVWKKDSDDKSVGVLGTGSAAANGKIAYVPSAAGEISATLIDSGFQLWTQVISGGRLGSARSFVTAVSGEPVVKGDQVYVGTQSGKLTAMNRRTGERKWTVEEGAVGPVWPVDDALFVLTDENKIKRLNASDGSEVWAQDLPLFAKVKRQKDAYAHFGPVLAGGRILVAGGDGLLRSYDPTSGALLSTTIIPNGAASHPTIAGGIMYILSNKGQLHAFQ